MAKFITDFGQSYSYSLSRLRASIAEILDPPGVRPKIVKISQQSRLYTKTLIIGCIQQPDGQFFYDQEEAELDEVEFQDVASWFNSNKRLSKKLVVVQQRPFPKRGGTGLGKGPEAKALDQRDPFG